LAKFPESSQRGDVQLVLIATDLRARNWTNAIAQLDVWIAANTNHPSLPRAKSDRAWAMAQAGFVTNAVDAFAELAARYPTNMLVPRMQLWLAGHFFNQGDYTGAEQACLSLVTNSVWRSTPEGHRARLWAADAARRRQSFNSARDHLLELLNDKTTPAELVPAAYFALGDLRLEQPPEDPAKPLGNVSLASEAFAAAAQSTNSPQAALALGRMADCQLQLATQNTNNYARAAELYRQVLGSSSANLAARCKASIGLGQTIEKVAGPRAEAEALERYLDVAHGKILRSGEEMDPWWVKESGREAGRILEVQKRWREAASLYDWLAQELPGQMESWRNKAAYARSHGGG
jgi:tetratricopeptide (TPR) repeat protein